MSHSIECIDLHKSFGPQKVLDSVSFTVEKGDIYGFLGPNGAGKSTTIRIIADLIRPDSGNAFINGLSVQKEKTKALVSVGMLIEKPSFYQHLSGETNLAFLTKLLPEIPRTEVDRVLELVDLKDAAAKMVKHYSQGMKQRLGIAQALMGDPDTVILDEPVNGLDPLSMKDMRLLMQRLRDEGKTVFLSSHLLHEVERVCSRMCIINKGTVVREGSVRDLLYDIPEFWVEFTAFDTDALRSLAVGVFPADRIETGPNGIHVKMKQEDIPEFIQACAENKVMLRSAAPVSNLEDYFLSMMDH